MNAVPRGRLVTLEGIEGAGKSTYAGTVRAVLEKHGIDVVPTREPGGTGPGEKLRDLLLSDKNAALTADAELLIMFAARADHVATVVLPALEAGRWVVSDRFTDASYAYQGGGRGCDRRLLGALEQAVCRGIRPDLTLLLDLAPEHAMARVKARGARDRFETETIEFFTRVREAYLERAGEEPRRWRVIPAQRPLREVEAAVVHAIEARFFTRA